MLSSQWHTRCLGCCCPVPGPSLPSQHAWLQRQIPASGKDWLNNWPTIFRRAVRAVTLGCQRSQLLSQQVFKQVPYHTTKQRLSQSAGPREPNVYGTSPNCGLRAYCQTNDQVLAGSKWEKWIQPEHVTVIVHTDFDPK